MLASEIKVGMEVFSKNDSEFYSKVSAVNGDKITVEYYDEYEEQETVSASTFTKMGDGIECPNWTFSFDQLTEFSDDEDEEY